MTGGISVKQHRHVIVGAVFVALVGVAAPARADGFVTPYIGYNFGGDSGNCPTLSNCSEKHTNYGVSIGAMGTLFGIEEDLGFAKNFFGLPGTDDSVFSAMTNLLVGIGVGPVQPYVLGGLGLIRSHVSSSIVGACFTCGPAAAENAFGYDLGGGVTVSVAPHVGIRGDIRHLHTLQDVNVSIFSGQHLNFYRGSLGVALKF
jgi:opacity protein-like surface antigen